MLSVLKSVLNKCVELVDKLPKVINKVNSAQYGTFERNLTSALSESSCRPAQTDAAHFLVSLLLQFSVTNAAEYRTIIWSSPLWIFSLGLSNPENITKKKN